MRLGEGGHYDYFCSKNLLTSGVALSQFEPYDHNHDLCQRIIINVSGTRFETQLRTLNKYPNTLLGDVKMRIRFNNFFQMSYFQIK